MNKLIASVTSEILFRTNSLLHTLASVFASETLSSYAATYSSWYNRYLIKQVIDTTGRKKWIKVATAHTRDELLIVEVEYAGISFDELSLYLLSSLHKITGITSDQIQIFKASQGRVKVIVNISHV